MVTVGSAPWSRSIVRVGPSNFLRVSVARMKGILRLRSGLHIGQMERPHEVHPLPAAAGVLASDRTPDLQGFRSRGGRLETEHEAVLLPDQRGAREQRVVLLDVTVRGDVEVGVLAARDERAEAVADAYLGDLGAGHGELLQVLALDAAAVLGEDQPGV